MFFEEVIFFDVGAFFFENGNINLSQLIKKTAVCN